MEQSLSPANWLHVSASGPWQLARVKPSADKRTPQLAPRALLAGEMLAEQRLPDRPSMPSSITCVTTFLQTEGRMAALFTNQRSDTLRPGESLRLFTPRWPGGA